MVEPSVIISLDGNGRTYWPGDRLSGDFWLESATAEEIESIEVSVLWHSEGKGDEDLHVHHFQRLAGDKAMGVDRRRPARFETILPNSPLSYDGQIVKIRWCVRVRAFLARGREIVGEKIFRLGAVPPARMAAKPSPPTAAAIP